MAVSQIQQAPYRQDRKLFPTPLIGDVLFSETRDCNRGNPFPEYGTPHPNAQRWPNHKLVFIKPLDIERNEIFEFFYAADRENQDLYNFSVGYRNIIGNAGGREFRVVQRSYVTPRADFKPLDIPFGTPMPNIPEGKFDDIEYVFFDRQQQQIDQQELNSLYVAEVHTYVEKAFLEYKLSYGAQKSDLVPEKFRAAIPQTTTEQIVEGLAEPPTLTGSQISVTEDQLNPDVKLVREVSRDKPTSEVVLNGSQSYVGGTVADITETYSPEKVEADSGFLIQESRVSPTGDGAYVRETVSVEEWPTLVSGTWDYAINGLAVRKQTMQDPRSLDDLEIPTTTKSITYEAVNKDRVVLVEEYAPKEIDSYLFISKTRINLNLPPVLKSINIFWDQDSATNESRSTGGDDALSIDEGTVSVTSSGREGATVSTQPIIDIGTEQVWSNDIIATNYFYYIQDADNYLSELNSKINNLSSPIQEWPVFKTNTYTLIGVGSSRSYDISGSRSVSVSKSVDREARSEAASGSLNESYNGSLDTIRIGPCLCRGLNLTNTTNVVKSTFDLTLNIPSLPAQFEVTATGSVRPTSLAATSPPDIPRSGYYVVDCRIEPYKWGYYKAIATVIDASQFAAPPEPTASIAPTIILHPASQGAFVGDTVTLSTVAEGQFLSYQWFEGGEVIPATDPYDDSAKGPSYTISNAQLSDSGNYAVRVSNTAGSVMSNYATLLINP